MTTLNSDDSNIQNNMAKAAVQSGAAVQGAQKGGTDDDFDETMRLNQVYYVLPVSISLASKRVKIINNFIQSSYTTPQNTTMTAIINTGEYFVQPQTSYLAIRVGIQSVIGTGDNALLGTTQIDQKSPSRGEPEIGYEMPNAGIMSMFEEISFTTASGTEVNREQKKNLYHRHAYPWTTAKGQKETYGTGEGMSWDSSSLDGTYKRWPEWNQGLPVGGKNRRNLNTNVTGGPKSGVMFWIPLHKLLGMFNPYAQALIPAALFAGGRLDIRTATPSTFLSAYGTRATNSRVATIQNEMNTLFTVQEIFLQLDAFQLNEGLLRRLNNISGYKGGFAYCFDSYDWTQTNTTQTSVDCQVSQAKSRIISSWNVVQVTDRFKNPFADKLAAEELIDRTSAITQGLDEGKLTVQSFQSVLGSLYFPQAPLKSFRDFYQNAWYIWNRGEVDEKRLATVTDEDFAGAKGQLGADQSNPLGVFPDGGAYNNGTTIANIWMPNYGSAIFGCCAERSSLLELSGIPISNARLLRHLFQFTASKDRQITTFTNYSKMARIFLGGRVIVRE